jgi:hypothetical protein
MNPKRQKVTHSVERFPYLPVELFDQVLSHLNSADINNVTRHFFGNNDLTTIFLIPPNQLSSYQLACRANITRQITYNSSLFVSNHRNNIKTVHLVDIRTMKLDRDDDLRYILEHNIMPSNMVHLIITSSISLKIPKNVLPKTLKMISFDADSEYNHIFEPGVLPYGLQKNVFRL